MYKDFLLKFLTELLYQVYYYLHHYTVREIASLLSLKEITVYKRIERGRKKLIELLETDADELAILLREEDFLDIKLEKKPE